MPINFEFTLIGMRFLCWLARGLIGVDCSRQFRPQMRCAPQQHGLGFEHVLGRVILNEPLGTPAVESRRDGRLEVRDSAAATGDWNSFQSRLNTGEHGLAIAKLHLSRKTHSDCHGRAPTPLRHRRGLQQRPHARSWAAQIGVNRNLQDTCGVSQ